MANLPEVDEFTAGVYQLEVTDPAEAGSGGIINAPFKALVNRTRYLFNRLGSNDLAGDIKEVMCTQAYITTNFDGTGLGRLERAGWAICNGSNGTVNLRDRVTVGYGGTIVGTSVPGAQGGNAVAHVSQAGYNVGGNTSTAIAGRLVVTTGMNEDSENLESIAAIGTTANDSALINIEQRFTVLLKIQKL